MTKSFLLVRFKVYKHNLYWINWSCDGSKTSLTKIRGKSKQPQEKEKRETKRCTNKNDRKETLLKEKVSSTWCYICKVTFEIWKCQKNYTNTENKVLERERERKPRKNKGI